MDRGDFVRLAGGVYRSPRGWSRWTSRQKWEGFWAFWTEHGGRSVYGGLNVRALVQRRHHSIEHVVPRAYLVDALADAPRGVRRGATVNPFNLAACHRRLNTARGDRWFAFDPDVGVRVGRKGGDLDATGIAADDTWLVPPRTRGDVARAILYMTLVYELPALDEADVDALVGWARADVASSAERAFCRWVQRRLRIRNPLVADADTAARMLEDPQLQRAMVAR